VVARADNSGTKQLAAYVVLHPQAAATELQLRDYLAGQLPSFMVPSRIVKLGKLPLTPNGKVDRLNLPPPPDSPDAGDDATSAPSDETEALLAGVWGEVLQRDRVGTHDNFFHMGGHSLLATQIVSRVARLLRVELPVSVLFESPTIAGMAKAVAERQQAGPAKITSRPDHPSRAEKLLDRLDELSDKEVEELLLELEEKETK
jgi:hypothetical protein